MIGETLSHYRITERLGQCGGGEAYRGEDTNLSRRMAMKVLRYEITHEAVLSGRSAPEMTLWLRRGLQRG